MATTTNEFNEYRIFFYGGSVGVGNTAIINLELNAVRVGNIIFYEGAVAPANTLVGSIITIYCPTARFRDALAVLQYEKPLYISYISQTGAGFISTELEDAGEQEGV